MAQSQTSEGPAEAAAGVPQSVERRAPLWMAVCLAIMCGAAYHNSFPAPFNFDDHVAILNNASIRSFSTALSPPPQMTTSGRPILNLTLALNYALSRFDVGSYHAVNLLIHLSAALVLFGLIRRTLLLDRFAGAYSNSANWIAMIAAGLWAVHPLQTMAVTYIVQRAESLAALFYLLTCYCTLRAATESRPLKWQVGAVLACALGMGTKEMMATAPIAVLLYDRVFLAGSFRAAITRRGLLYTGLMFSWVILAALTMSGPRSETAGFGLKDWTAFEYARTQPEVILHYFTLILWPRPLVLDYEWPIAVSYARIIPSLAAVLILLWLSLRAALRGSGLGFLGLLIFLLLSVTSSFIPINIVASEHRMYLPLAPAILIIVLAAHSLLARVARAGGPDGSGRMVARFFGGTLFLVIAGVLIFATIERNRDYHSILGIWTQAMQARPNNPRAVNSVGYAYSLMGRFDQAIPFYRRAIELKPAYSDAHFNLAEDLRRLKQLDEAAREYQAVLQLTPREHQAHAGLGGILVAKGRLKEAIDEYQAALSIRPNDVASMASVAVVLAVVGRTDESVTMYQRAIALRPEDPALHMQLGSVLAGRNHFAEAGDQFAEALRLDPANTQARYRFGLTRLSLGRAQEAVVALRQCAQELPGDAEIRLNLGRSLNLAGDTAGAITELHKATELDPKSTDAKAELAWILATHPDDKLRNAEEAVRLAESASQAASEKNFALLDTLGAAYANAGRFDDAVRAAGKALDLARAAKAEPAVRKISDRLAGYRERRPFRAASQ